NPRRSRSLIRTGTEAPSDRLGHTGPTGTAGGNAPVRGEGEPMRPIDRRTFLRLGGVAAAGVALGPKLRFPTRVASAAGTGTTLDSTIVKGSLLRAGTRGSYYRLAAGPGEPHLVRSELAQRTAPPAHRRRRSLLNFVHLTDIHLVDAQSPARVEFLDRYRDP